VFVLFQPRFILVLRYFFLLFTIEYSDPSISLFCLFDLGCLGNVKIFFHFFVSNLAKKSNVVPYSSALNQYPIMHCPAMISQPLIYIVCNCTALCPTKGLRRRQALNFIMAAALQWLFFSSLSGVSGVMSRVSGHVSDVRSSQWCQVMSEVSGHSRSGQAMSGVSGHFTSGHVRSVRSLQEWQVKSVVLIKSCQECQVISRVVRSCQWCHVMSDVRSVMLCQVMSVSGVLGHVRSVRSFQEWVRSVRSCQWCHVMSGHVNHVRSFSKKLLKLTVTVNLLLMQCPKGHIF
jgi:hypothetical protein